MQWFLRFCAYFVLSINCVNGATAAEEPDIKLLIHAGLRKTGSTSLQYVLGQNADAFLRKEKVLVWNSDALKTKELQAGTINDFPDMLCKEPSLLETIFQAATEKEATTVILTSETAIRFGNKENCQFVVEKLNESPFSQWKMVIFIRSLYESVWSSYIQVRKNWPDVPDNRKLVDMWVKYLHSTHRFASEQSDNVVCVAYDTCKEDLLKAFWKAGGLDDLSSDYGQSCPTINRSLSMNELNLFEIILQAQREQRSNVERLKYSNYLITTQPNEPTFYYQHPELLSLLKEMGGEALTVKMNSILKEGKITFLSLEPEKYLTEWDKDLIDPQDVKNVLLSHDQYDKFESSPYKEKCPKGFDGVQYLTLNLDILAQLRDPYQHFLEEGQKEGRPWQEKAPETA